MQIQVARTITLDRCSYIRCALGNSPKAKRFVQPFYIDDLEIRFIINAKGNALWHIDCGSEIPISRYFFKHSYNFICFNGTIFCIILVIPYVHSFA